MRRQALEEIGLVAVYTKMAELHLRLGPGEGRRAAEGRGIAALVGDLEHRPSRVGERRPERDAHRRARRDADAPAQTEDWVEHGADRAAQAAAAGQRQRGGEPAAAA